MLTGLITQTSYFHKMAVTLFTQKGWLLLATRPRARDAGETAREETCLREALDTGLADGRGAATKGGSTSLRLPPRATTAISPPRNHSTALLTPRTVAAPRHLQSESQPRSWVQSHPRSPQTAFLTSYPPLPSLGHGCPLLPRAPQVHPVPLPCPLTHPGDAPPVLWTDSKFLHGREGLEVSFHAIQKDRQTENSLGPGTAFAKWFTLPGSAAETGGEMNADPSSLWV